MRLLLYVLLALALPVLASPTTGDAKSLIAQIERGDDRKVQDALEGLKALGAGGVEGLITATKHKKAWVRATAWRWLGELGADARPALEPLCATLAAEPREEWASSSEMSFGLAMQMQMLGTLVHGGPFDLPRGESKERIAELEQTAERLAALSALSKIGSTDPAALVILIEKTEVPLDRGYPDLYAGFASASSKAKDAGKTVVASGLDHASPRVQAASLLACCVLEKRATDLGPQVAKLLDSPDAGVRGLAAEAVGRVRHPCDGVRQRLLELLDDESAFVRHGAARTIAIGCDDPESALETLLKNMADASTFARISAIGVLSVMSEEPLTGKRKSREFRSEAAVKPLGAALADASPEVRRRAASTLGSYGALAKPALPALRKAAKDANKDVKLAAEKALESIQKS